MDFAELLSFRKMITPGIIQILFWIGAVLSVLVGLGMIIGGLASRAPGLAFMGLIYLLIGPIMIRVYCELIILFFRIYDELVAMRQAIAPAGGGGFPVEPVAPMPVMPPG